MDIVTDTHLFLAVALNEPEKTRIVQLTSNSNAIAPEILPYEIGNALSAMIKRKQITHDEALSAFEIASKVPVRLVSIDILKALELALEFNIYAYDAYFLQCAKSLSYPLFTLDKRMKQVAMNLNIEVLE
mgnify:FL=1